MLLSDGIDEGEVESREVYALQHSGGRKVKEEVATKKRKKRGFGRGT